MGGLGDALVAGDTAVVGDREFRTDALLHGGEGCSSDRREGRRRSGSRVKGRKSRASGER